MACVILYISESELVLAEGYNWGDFPPKIREISALYEQVSDLHAKISDDLRYLCGLAGKRALV